MADRTSQPPAGIGIRASYASAALFLWNAVDPGKNALTGADTTSAIRGTNTSGADGLFQHFSNTDGSINFAIANTDLSTTGYTLIVGFCLPAASRSEVQMLNVAGSIRFQYGTTPGGMRASLVHTGIAGATSFFEYDLGGVFDSELWTYEAVFTGSGGTPANELRQYLRRGDGTVAATTSETIAAPSSTGTSLEVGNSPGSAASGSYAAALLVGPQSDAEAIAVRDNIWRMFAETGGGGGTRRRRRRKFFLPAYMNF